MAKKITVITPTYNRAKMLPEVLNSLFAQTFQDFEHLIIDDGSTDNTKQTIEALIKDKPQYTYFYKENGGEASAVNQGWQMATGDYVVIVNSDDPQPPAFLETLLTFMEKHKDVSVGYPDWIKIDANGKEVSAVIVPEYSYEKVAIEGECLPGPGAIIRRADFKEIKELRDGRFPLVTDMSCWLTLGATGKKFSRIPHKVSYWRIHDESATLAVKGTKIAKDRYDLFKSFWDAQTNPQLTQFKRASMAHVAFSCGVKILSSKHSKIEFISYWAKGFLWSPCTFIKAFFMKLKRVVAVES